MTHVSKCLMIVLFKGFPNIPHNCSPVSRLPPPLPPLVSSRRPCLANTRVGILGALRTCSCIALMQLYCAHAAHIVLVQPQALKYQGGRWTLSHQFQDTFYTLKRLTGASSVSDLGVGHLLGQWATSHSHASSARKQAATTALHPWLQEQDAHILSKLARGLIPVEGGCKLLITMNVPKLAFHALSSYVTVQAEELQAEM
mmetsp:Transcript_125199/g.216967  ORF Transcript_125199/g.216967 Transcript_125199/m.216967 type:complete len:200 (-) Transcript_125199:499-1098(-)